MASQGDRGRFTRERDILLPLAMVLCVVLGWYVELDYERTAVELAPQAPVLLSRVWGLRLMMSLLTLGSLGLAWLAAHDAKGRRRAEAELQKLNAVLADRVVRRTAALKASTEALRDARLREVVREKDAAVAFQAGLLAAAGQYFHDVGNALSALELELLRLGKAIEGADRLRTVFLTVAGHIEAGRLEAAASLLTALREAVLSRTYPRVRASQQAINQIRDRMLDELEHRRASFDRDGSPERYIQSFRLDLELAAVLDRLPRAAGSDPVVRDIDLPITVRTRKHAFLTGLAEWLRQLLDNASGPVTVRLGRGEAGRVVFSVEGVRECDTTGPDAATFINFLNENEGTLRFEPEAGQTPPRYLVELDESLPETAIS